MSPSGDSNTRVGNAERQSAIEALNEHWRAGRLDPAEHERRTTAAFAAVTRGDLDVLFADLPGGPTAGPGSLAGSPGTPPLPTYPEPSTDRRGGEPLIPPDSWVGRHRDAVSAAIPILAVILFAVTKTWVWFLLIPVAFIVLQSGDHGGRDRRRRNRD